MTGFFFVGTISAGDLDVNSFSPPHMLQCELQIKTMTKELDIAFLTVGFDPKWAVADVPIMPKNRYK